LYCKLKFNNKNYYEKNKYPIFVCSFCGQKQQLDFEPNIEKKKWENYKCKICGKINNPSICA